MFKEMIKRMQKMKIKVMTMMHWALLHNKSSATVMSRMRMMVMVVGIEDDIGNACLLVMIVNGCCSTNHHHDDNGGNIQPL